MTNHDSTDGEDELLGNTPFFGVDVAFFVGFVRISAVPHLFKDDDSARASHKEVTTQTEKLLTTERKDTARPARKPCNRAKARNNTLRRSEEGRSTGVSLETKNRHILHSA